MVNLLDLIGRDVQLRRTSAVRGGEYSGPCPLCRQGRDRLKVWPRAGRWACLGPRAGRAGCDRYGDAIQYLRERDGLGFAEACAALGVSDKAGLHRRAPDLPITATQPTEPPLRPPNAIWQARGRVFVEECHDRLLTAPEAERARAWLRTRCLKDETVQAFQLGYNPADRYEDPVLWGLPSERIGCRRRIWLPRGIVIPWWIDGELWRVNIRRPLSRRQLADGKTPKYIGPAGWANGLFNADQLAVSKPVIVVEGEFDAMVLQQTAGRRIVAVATGSTGGGRRAKWLARLAMASKVLVTFDVDTNCAGDQAAAWWIDALTNAVRWRPLWHDVSEMYADQFDMDLWIDLVPYQ